VRASHRSRVGSDSRPKRSNTVARPCRDLTGFLLRESILTIGRGSPLCQMPVRCHDFETAILGRLRWLVPAYSGSLAMSAVQVGRHFNCSILVVGATSRRDAFPAVHVRFAPSDFSEIGVHTCLCLKWVGGRGRATRRSHLAQVPRWSRLAANSRPWAWPGLSRQGYSMPSPVTSGLPKREIFNDEVAIAPRERATTSAARYLAISGFCTDLGLDDVVGGIAIRASEKWLIYCGMTRCVAP
jgi:hypothetical protein